MSSCRDVINTKTMNEVFSFFFPWNLMCLLYFKQIYVHSLRSMAQEQATAGAPKPGWTALDDAMITAPLMLEFFKGVPLASTFQMVLPIGIPWPNTREESHLSAPTPQGCSPVCLRLRDTCLKKIPKLMSFQVAKCFLRLLGHKMFLS